ncbi:52 kDa repressor of the inhibitor of the protein kinase-like [Harmonia axyridis]|uniref:52 kDa repressor of the inhibitor of the protein kinase-like n=1 Tax=Harmonia axyridis TaxID=115357 RepID=UPI001E278DD2|nr:52 kDa repressor of the inhibitor of the protein kinase-like [Harmonia axyridis]
MPHGESTKNSGNFSDLLKFRVDAGDKDFEIQEEANFSKYFSVMADESADISGHEQLSIGIRYVHEQNENFTVNAEFLGFVQLKKLNADCIAVSILEFMEKSGLNFDKLVAQGYDECSTMAGEIHGVQKIIRDKYKKVIHFHCAYHRLN